MDKEKKIYSVSVGIIALNEEKSIGAVLDSVLSQERDGWLLNEILVYSDGSTDGTVTQVKKRKSTYIKIFDFKERKGKSFRLNQLFNKFQTDVLVIFDADVQIANESVITNLVNGFRIDEKIMIVGGDSRIFPPKNFFEKAISTSYYVYFKSREELRGGDNVFACTGACIALRHEFAKSIKIPHGVISDDTYLYFSCIKSGYKFKYAPQARVYYKIAANLKDFLRQMFRSHPEAIQLGYKKYFGELLKREYYRPKVFYIKAVLEIFVKNPIGTLFMVGLKLISKPFYIFFSKKYKLDWFTAATTKGKI